MARNRMENYNNLVKKVLATGEYTENRTGVDTLELFGETLEFDLAEGFPILTQKKINFNNLVTEVLWYLKGTDKLIFLHEHNVHIWDNWMDENFSIGPTYGAQWRNFEGIDQLQNVINEIKENPTSRRLIVNGWNPIRLNEMRLPPCITQFQFNVNSYNELDMIVYQRSADLAIGVPYDIAEMAILQTIIAKLTGLKPRKLKFMYGNVHIYANHVEKLNEFFNATVYDQPKLEIATKNKLEDYKHEDFKLIGYTHSPFIKFDIAV